MAKVKKSGDVEKGKLDIQQIREMINKKSGTTTAWDLEDEENPTTISGWISTGSHPLDCLIAKGIKAGCPIGKVTMLEGISGSGKSFACALLAKSAQDMGITVVYFDSESATDVDFWRAAKVDVSKILYVQAVNIEFVFETIEELLSTDEQYLFILDSYAACPCLAEQEGGYNPQEGIARKPRITGLALKKLTQPIANKKATLVMTNHLFTNIPRSNDNQSRVDAMIDPLVAPGGLTIQFYPSLRLQMTGKKNKASFVTNSAGHVVGTETKIKIKKSRFGTYNREIFVKLLWNSDEVRFADEETWIEILKASESVNVASKWTLKYADGSEHKFYSKDFKEELGDPKFKARVIELVEEILITDFASQKGNASVYYNIEEKD